MSSVTHANKKDVVEVESIALIVYMNEQNWQTFTKKPTKNEQ